MRLSSAVKIAGIVGLVAAVTVIAATKSIDFERYKGSLSQIIERETGRKLTFAGPLKLRLGLVPSLVAEGVSLANVAGGSRAEMIKIERIEAEIALPALLRKEVLVQRLIISSPDIILEKRNWDWGTGTGATTASTATPTRFNLRELKIKNARIAWRDDNGQGAVNLHKLSVVPEPGVASGDLGVSLVGDRDGKMFDLAGKIGNLGAAQAGKPWPLSLKAAAPGAIVTVNGAIGRLTEMAGLDLKVTAQVDELGDFLRLVGLRNGGDGPPLGSVRLATRITGSAAAPALAEIDVAAGRRDGVVLAVKGAVKDARALTGMDLSVQADGESLAGLSALTGMSLPAWGPVHAAGALRDGHGGWSVSELKASLGGSDLTGELSYVPGVPRPHLTATLVARQLAFIDQAPARTRAGTAGPLSAAAVPVAPAAADGRVIPDLAVPAAALAALDVDLSLRAERVVAPGLTLSALATQVHVKDGRAVVTPLQAGLAGGTLDGEIRLDGHAAQPGLDLRLDGRGIDAGQVLRDTGLDGLTGGPAQVSLRLATRGAGLRAWAANLSGTMQVSLGAGQIRNGAIAWAGTDLATRLAGALNPLGPSRDSTALTCAVAHFRVKDGVAVAERGLAAETDGMTVTGGGTIDLRRESLDLAFAPRATEGLGLSVGTQVAGLTRLGGTLAHPSLAIDEMGVARNALSAAAAASTGGLSLLGEALWDRVSADSHPCQTALNMGVPGGKAATKPAAKAKPGMLNRLFGH